MPPVRVWPVLLVTLVACGSGNLASPVVTGADGMVLPEGQEVQGDSGPLDPGQADAGHDGTVPPPDACTPKCGIRVCGPDGCGGSCGTCEAPKLCNGDGICVCLTACAGKVCGPDGCGGSCGTCQAGAECTDGACVCAPNHHKGCCGSAVCWFDSCGKQGAWIETCTHGCNTDHCGACTPSCQGKTCGDDGCGGLCGKCPGAQDACVNGQCVCQKACVGKQCGPDGCGGACGTCQAGYQCIGSACVCQPDCSGKECGNDGCGGSCGTCANGATCNKFSHKCVGGCVPDCKGKACGSDGCGGSCGTCKAQEVCAAGLCISTEPCTGLPQSWGPAGAIATMKTPKDAVTVQSQCPDFSGDGKGDNGLAAIADLGGFGFDLNQMIQQGVDSGQLGMVFEFQGVTDFVNTAKFPLNGLRGKPGGSGFLLDAGSYDGKCNPLVSFKDAKIAVKALSAGPGVFLFLVPIGNGYLAFALQQARMSGTVTSGGPGGVVLDNGVLGGLLTQAELDNTLAAAKKQCAGANPPSFCPYLDYLPMFLQMDVDTNGDGSLDAMTMCFLVTLKAAKIVGYL